MLVSSREGGGEGSRPLTSRPKLTTFSKTADTWVEFKDGDSMADFIGCEIKDQSMGINNVKTLRE